MTQDLYEIKRDTFFYLQENVVAEYCKYLFRVDYKSMYDMEKISDKKTKIKYKFRLPWDYSDDPCIDSVLEINNNEDGTILHGKLYQVSLNEKNFGYHGGVIIHTKYSTSIDGKVVLHITNEIGCGSLSRSNQRVFLDENIKDVYKDGLEQIRKIVNNCL
jgi:hypothetical protein